MNIAAAQLREWQRAAREHIEQSPYHRACADGQGLDLCALADSGRELASQIVRGLLGGGTLNLELEASEAQRAALQRFYVQAKIAAHGGQRTAAIGYPLFIEKNDENPFAVMAAPLFIWQIGIEPSPNREHTWILRRTTAQPLLPNWWALGKLQEWHGIDLRKICEDLVLAQRLDAASLSQLANELSARLGTDGNISALDLRPCPDAEDLDARELGQPTLQWSGVMGHFGAEPLSLPRYYAQFKEDTKVCGPHDFGERLPIFQSRHDSDQGEALAAIFRDSVSLVEGATGTGKSFTLGSAAEGALSMGMNCLVLVPNGLAAQQMAQRLRQLGMGHLSLSIVDAENDKLPLMAKLNEAAQTAERMAKQAPPALEGTIKLLRAKRAKLQTTYGALSGEMLGSYDRYDIYGQFLKNQRIEGREMLDHRLSTALFDFSMREYEQLKDLIYRSEPLFQRVMTLDHPLLVLHPRHFEQSANRAADWIGAHLSDFHQRATELLRKYVVVQDDYKFALSNYYDETYFRFQQGIDEIRRLIIAHVEKYGDDFLKSSNMKLQMMGVLSKKFQAIGDIKGHIQAQFAQLAKTVQDTPIIEYQFSAKGDQPSVRKIGLAVEEFAVALEEWRKDGHAQVRSEMKQLSAASASEHLEASRQVSALELDSDLLVQAINEAELFAEGIGLNSSSLASRQKDLERLIAMMERTAFHMRDFDAFHPWQAHWQRLGNKDRALLEALVAAKPRHWAAAFKSWYYHHLLLRTSPEDLAFVEESTQQYLNMLDQVRGILPDHTRLTWAKSAGERLRQHRREQREAHQNLFGKQAIPQAQQLFMRDVLRLAAPVLSALFPVIIVTPDILCEQFPADMPPFDLVLVDDAHSLPAWWALPALRAGHTAALFSNPSLALDKDADALSEWMGSKTLETLSLNHAHRQGGDGLWQNAIHTHQDLWHFRFPQDFDWRVEQVNGRYLEGQQQNPAEANAILQHLAQMNSGVGELIPVVGIVALTEGQRDLIHQRLLVAKQRRELESDVYRQLEERGMKVLLPHELAYQSFDVLLISLCFGAADLSGRLSRDAEWLNSKAGIHAVHHITAAAKSGLYLFSSLPVTFIEKHYTQRSKWGAFLYSNWLLYADARHLGNEGVATQVLHRIEARLLPSEQEMEQQKQYGFVPQVITALQPYFEGQRLVPGSPLQHYGLYAFSLLPRYEGQPLFVIIGGYKRPSLYARDWERSIIQRLEARHCRVFIARPAEWWRNPQQEARLLASQLIRAEQEYMPAEPNQLSEAEGRIAGSMTDEMG